MSSPCTGGEGMFLLAKWFSLVAGCALIAAGVNFFLVPYKILDGGILGMALIGKYLWQFPVGLGVILWSVPLFTMAWFHNRLLYYNSLQGMLLSSLLIDLSHPYLYYFLYYVEIAPWASAICGGGSIGLGIGIMLRNGISTGGMDLLAQYMAERTRINAGLFLFAFDGLVIALGGVLLSAETLYLSAAAITTGGVATFLCCLKMK